MFLVTRSPRLSTKLFRRRQFIDDVIFTYRFRNGSSEKVSLAPYAIQTRGGPDPNTHICRHFVITPPLPTFYYLTLLWLSVL